MTTPAGLAGTKALIDEDLAAFLAEQTDQLTEVEVSTTPLLGELSRVVFSGGKRLRPMLCYWGHMAGGGSHSPAILRVATSMEMLHTFAFIHDDIMDVSTSRRDSVTSWMRLGVDRSGEEIPGKEDFDFGKAAAILVGDLALVLSDVAFTSSGFSPEALARAFPAFHEMRIKAAAGQYMDISSSPRDLMDPERLKKMAELKTASYSCEGPLLVGSILAGGSPEVQAALASYGRLAGKALQLRDDIQGLFTDDPDSGHFSEPELQLGRVNLLLAGAAKRATPDQLRALRSAWGNPNATDEQLDEAIAAVRDSGSLAWVVGEIEDLKAGAVAAVKSCPDPIPGEAVSALVAMAGMLDTSAYQGRQPPK